MARRRKELLREVERRGFETIVLLNEVVNQNPGNFIYLCPDGIGDEHQTLVLGVNGDVTLVCPHWGAKAADESGKYTKVVAVRQEKGHHMRGTQVALTGYNPDRVCFDLSTMSSQFAYTLTDTIHIKIDPKKDLSDHIFTMRSIKDEYEVSEMRRAINITENAVYELIQGAIPGADTWKLKKRLDARLIELGALDHSFDSSVSFCRGPRRPYGVVKHNDLISVDVGVRVESGYCSDMGRTWPVTLDADAKDFLDRVVAVQREGIKHIREGVSGNEVLRYANTLHEELGFEPTPRSGHQIGLDVHDYTMPFATNFGSIETDALPLKAGMTLTYEPIRVDSKLGMRSHVEDIVLVTKGDPVILNQMPWDVVF
ncbi:MAG: M24 family metallopeptidase [Candidatus Bathyarchaeia archaeon]